MQKHVEWYLTKKSSWYLFEKINIIFGDKPLIYLIS